MDDRTIIELFGQRSEAAISETAKKYGALCGRVARNILANEQDAEECVNDAYLALWQAIPPTDPDSLGAFLCGITRNLALKKYEYNNSKKRRAVADISLDELAGCLPDTADTDGDETAELINSFLGELDPVSRRVFIRRYWFMDSIAVIAGQYGMSRSKVKSMLHRLRGRLKKYLEKEGISV